MPKITKVYSLPANPPKYPEAKVLNYIDGVKCTPVRERTWQAMNLKVGDTITCEDLKLQENFHCKNEYAKIGAWEREKTRLSAVKNYIESIDSRIEAVITGFGANSTELIEKHPDEKGKPDVEVIHKNTKLLLIYVEVSGTETMRGSNYWVRPDKLTYAQNHSDDDVWIILHYALPQEKFVFIKPMSNKTYVHNEVVIRNSTEYYVFFDDSMEECKTSDEFKDYLINLI